MRTLIFTALLIGCSAICNAQEKQSDTTKVKFKPPVIVKDETAKTETKEEVKFTPPVIVKEETSKGKKQKGKEEVKFTPPVIVKDPEKKQ
jgi:hypothetical protein